MWAILVYLLAVIGLVAVAGFLLVLVLLRNAPEEPRGQKWG